MSEHDTIEKVKNKQGILDRIQNFFTLGYGTKEDLRELDKKLRDIYYGDLRDMRHVWEDVHLAAIDAGVSGSSRDFKKITQVLDRVMEKVRHADYGYAGLMDRKGHIREGELARVFNYDKTLSGDVDGLRETIDKALSKAEAEDWTDMPAEAKRIKTVLLEFEKKWTQRNDHFRPMEV